MSRLRHLARLVVVTAVVAGTLGLVARPATASEPPPDPIDVAPVEVASAEPVPVQFTLTPIVAEAGYFLAEGTCPSSTSYLSYRWTGASNGNGWGNVAQRSGPFSLALRMLAAAPAQTISVTLRCMRSNGRTRLNLGTVDAVSGVDLLPVPADSGTGRRIVYSVSAQQLWAIEADETLAKTHLVSGRRLSLVNNRSQVGAFSVYAKKRSGCGGGCPHWLSFHRAAAGIIGFHQIPFNRRGAYQSVRELGQPRSHGCVRQSKEDAIWLWNWAVVGDVVIVVP